MLQKLRSFLVICLVLHISIRSSAVWGKSYVDFNQLPLRTRINLLMRHKRIPGFYTDRVAGTKIQSTKDYADLRDANLNSANLRGVFLERVDLTGAELSRADLSDACITYSDLSKARLDGANLVNASLHKTELSGANLEKARLVGAKLTMCIADKASLRGIEASGLRLHSVSLVNADLRQADLTNVLLNKVDFLGTCLQGSNINEAKIIYMAKDLNTGVFKFNRLSKDERVAYVKKYRFAPHCSSSGFIFRANCKGLRLDGSDLYGAALDYADFTGASMIGVDLRKARLSHCIVADTDISRANFRGTLIRNVDLGRAKNVTMAHWLNEAIPPYTWFGL